ncbi:MAG: ABC transporter permease [Saprospiraceae bacterium]|nr:ABC transporter permease [Saprospiraceae bacterium]
MLRNYFKIAIRNLWNNKLFSFINIVGLALAIPFALLSFLSLQSSFEFDNFHPDEDRIFRVITDEKSNEGIENHYATSPFLLAETLKKDYPVVERATKTVRTFGWELSNRLKSLKVNTIFVEPEFFNIFGFGLEKGSLPTEVNSLVLSHEMAELFFNETDPVGKTLTHPTFGVFKITGVLKPFKKQTMFRSDAMISMASYVNFNKNEPNITSWGNYDAHTFVKTILKSDIATLSSVLNDIAKKTNHLLVREKKSHQFRIQSISDISPSAEKLRNNPYVEDITDIAFNFSIPLLLLLLAGFNYTNLTLARSLSRAREVGVRKVMGALRSQLILQFVCEAIVIAVLSLILGFVFLQIMKETIHVNWVTWEVENQILVWTVFLVFAILLGFLAGMLPAWILSGFQSVDVLKGNLTPASFGKVSFRKSLMVIQFVVSMVFIFWMGHMYNQFQYMATENENYNRKGIFNINMVDNNYSLLKDELYKNKSIKKIGLTSTVFGGITAETYIKARKQDENKVSYYYSADHNYIENMNLEFVAGQNLPESLSDSVGNFILVNEKAVEKLHLGTSQEAIGKSVFINNESEVIISGVLKDFCHYNYQFQIEPVIIQYNPSQFMILSILAADNINEATFLSEMQAAWKKIYPTDFLVSSWFAKDMYERYYPAEDMKIMGLAALIILTIAVMGLLGIVIYSTEKRTKEVGVRKVMGASLTEIVRVLSWSFMKLLLIAGTISLPIGFALGLVTQKIFTFHSNININLMLGFFVSILVIAVCTIGFFSIKAALMNPAKSLRSE